MCITYILYINKHAVCIRWSSKLVLWHLISNQLIYTFMILLLYFQDTQQNKDSVIIIIVIWKIIVDYTANKKRMSHT